MTYRVSKELEKILDFLLGEEKRFFIEQIGRQLPHTIRFNTLKGSASALKNLLREQGFRFEPILDFKDIYRITHQPYSIGKSLSHFLGHIYVQDIASMLPPIVLNPRSGDRVLDMSAAPGSKTTQMAAMMQNQGVILANDVVSKRLRALSANLQRMGIVNTIIFKWFGEQFGNRYFEQFDRILLDPACSGLGTLHKSPEVLSWWSSNHCLRLAESQRKLMISAIKALRPEGVLTYSTCTLTPEENEEIIDFALQNFPMELEEVSLPGLKTRPGLTRYRDRVYHVDLKKAIRLYPFENDTEGFFIARLRKAGSLPPPNLKKPPVKIKLSFLSHKTSPVKKYLDAISEQFEIPRDLFRKFTYSFQNHIVFISPAMAEFPFYGNPIQMGLTCLRATPRGAKITTEGAHLFGSAAKRMIVELPDLTCLERFVNRATCDIPAPGTGQVIVKYKDCIIGYGIALRGKLKSQFPKGEWPFKVTASPKGLM